MKSVILLPKDKLIAWHEEWNERGSSSTTPFIVDDDEEAGSASMRTWLR